MAGWYNESLFSVSISYKFFTSKKKFKKDYRKYIGGKPPNPLKTENCNATCWTCTDRSTGDITCFMFFDKKVLRSKDLSLPQKLGIVVHESMHLLQSVKCVFGESSWHDEVEAYAIQSISQSIIKEALVVINKDN